VHYIPCSHTGSSTQYDGSVYFGIRELSIYECVTSSWRLLIINLTLIVVTYLVVTEVQVLNTLENIV